jgi:iron complex outermembrane receptor protein
LLVTSGTLGYCASPLWADQDREAPPRDEQDEQESRAPRGHGSEKKLAEEMKELISKTGSKTPKPIFRAPSSISVISGTDLQRSGARFVSDALRMVPGIEVLRTTSTESNVAARGYNDVASTAQGMLGLVDGRLVYNDFFGSVLWDALPVSIEEIDRIEVIRGPGSFLYGPSAMHGLVNIITKSPLDYGQDILHLTAAAGTYRSSVATAMYVKREDDAGFKATIGWDNIARFQPRDEGASDKVFAEFRYEQEIGVDQRLELTGGAMTQDLEVLISSQNVIPSADLSNEVQELFVKANYTLGDLETQLVWTGFDGTSSPDRFYTPFDVDLDTVDLDLQYSLSPWEDHTITVGAGYSYATFTTTNADVSNGRHDTNLVWGFVQDELRLGEDVFVTAGVRLDWYSTSGFTVSPRLATVWEFEENQNLRASAGVGFRNPSLRENFFDMPVTVPGFPPLTIQGNENLDAETMLSLELGYFGAPTDSLKAGVNVFYNFVNDLIVFRPVPGSPTTLAPFNRNDEDVYGFEIEGEYLFSDWISGFANYSYEIRQNRDTSERILSAPQNKANVGVRVSTGGGFSAMLWLNYFDETAFNGVPVDAYVLLNGELSYTFPIGQTEGRVFLQAFNLVDHHKEHPDGQFYDAIVMAGFGLTW